MKQILILFLALTSITFLPSRSFSQSSSASRTDTRSRADGSAPDTSGKNVSVEVVKKDMTEALSVIEDNYVGGKSLNYNDLFKTSIDSMLHTLDPHSNYFDAKEFDQFKTEQSSRYYGIGATIGDLSDENGNVIAT